MSGFRFTAWLSREERDELRSLAEEQRCSVNLIVRMAVRHLLFDDPIPSYLKREKVTHR